MNGEQTPPAPPAPPSYAPPPPGGGSGDGPRLPWDDRDRLGFVGAFIETVKLTVTAPGDAYRRLRADGDYFGPLFYGLILSWIGMFFGQLWSLLMGSALTSMMGDIGAMGAVAGTSFIQMIILLVVWPFIYAISVFIMAGIYHLCLMLVGGVADSPTGFEGTFKVVTYSSVYNLCNIVPFIGGLIGFVWMVILLTVGFTEAHRTSQGKALGGVLLPIVLCCLCGVLIAVIFGASIAAMIAGANG